MNEHEDDALGEISNIEAARLALRGALATVRDLQKINGQIKGELQDEVARHKGLKSQIVTLNERLDQWQKQSEAWELERKQIAAAQEKWKEDMRVEVRADEAARIEQNRRQLDEQLAQLRADLELMAKSNVEKDSKWAQLRREIESRDAEVLTLQREKIELFNRYSNDAKMFEQLRSQRDRETEASIRSRELELKEKDKQIAEVRSRQDETRRELESATKDFESRLLAREEALTKEYRAKEQTLVEKFSQREAELQQSWSELENNLWQKTKTARDKLDESVNAQFEERARALADRSKEIEAQLADKQKNLEEEVVRRIAETERRYADKEKRLALNWNQKEQNLLAKMEEEIAHEKSAIAAQWAERFRTQEAEHLARTKELALKAELLEADYKNKLLLAGEAQARKDAERVRAQDSFIAQKTAELELDYAQKKSQCDDQVAQVERSFRAKADEIEREFAQKKTQYEEKIIEIERASRVKIDDIESDYAVKKQQCDEKLAENERSLRSKTAELDKAHGEFQEEFQKWKASVLAENAQKEKELNRHWFAREQELVRKYELSSEQQRRGFEIEIAKTTEQFEEQRMRADDSFAQREHARQEEYERRERELRGAWALREEQVRRLHETALADLREQQSREISGVREQAAAELLHEKTLLQEDLSRARESQSALQTDYESAQKDHEYALRTMARKVERLEKDYSKVIEREAVEAQSHHEALERQRREFIARAAERENEIEEVRQNLENAYREREKTLHKNYKKLEDELRARFEG